jgi:hypothetical protein
VLLAAPIFGANQKGFISMRASSFLLTLTAALALILPARAATGDDVPPAKVDLATYEALSCEQLASYSTTLDAAYLDRVDRLKSAQTKRMITWMFLAPSSTSKSEGAVAEIKGRQLAVRQAEADKSSAASGMTTASAEPAAVPMPAAAHY